MYCQYKRVLGVVCDGVGKAAERSMTGVAPEYLRDITGIQVAFIGRQQGMYQNLQAHYYECTMLFVKGTTG